MKVRTSEATEHMLGVGLVGASAVIFGLAGVMTKAIEADALTITCWRGLVGGSLVFLYVMGRRGGAGAPASLRLGWRGWLITLIGAFASIAFITAFKYTYVANAAIIYATVPFATALLARIILGERFRQQTMIAALVSLAGVAIMVLSGLGTGGLIGDFLALLMTFSSALYMVLIRSFRDTPVVWAGAISSFLLFGLGWLVTDPLSISQHDAILVVVFGCSFALASILWTEGARLIPAAESALLGTAEVPSAILFALLFIGELPPVAAITGGAIVLFAVAGHAALDWQRARTAAPA